MPSSPRVVIIVNPRSQGGALGRRWPELADTIRRSLPFEDVMTKEAGDATRLAREALRAGAETVVAVGGDGTINEVANGWFDNGVRLDTDGALGVLPFGTGGDFVRTVNISKEWDRAVANLARGHRRRIDLGRVDHRVRTGGDAIRMFINIGSFGLSGVTDRLVNQSKKRMGGRISFFLGTTRALMAYDNQRVRMTFDERAADAVDMTVSTVAVANGCYFGGGMFIAPDAKLDDGYFDVIAMGDLSMKDFILKSRRLYRGTHLTMDKVSHRRAKIVRAEPAAPDQIVELDIDGETPGVLPATFRVLPAALDLIAPAP
ncbi:MAG TPA: diacylglycerol kinase family protein [Kofleriaceae bacterium]|nr:diacylglycerol kinase family protein [Kofleriaceae bacterium]